MRYYILEAGKQRRVMHIMQFTPTGEMTLGWGRSWASLPHYLTEQIMYLVDRNATIKIPASVAVCPICGAEVVIDDIDEWSRDFKGRWRVTEGGLHLSCATEPDIEDDEWWEWFNGHFSTPYIDWLPVSVRVWKWLDENYRFNLHG